MSKKRIRKQIILLLGILLPWALSAQVLWPGDVNDNGVVNGVDALYWSFAVGQTGPARSDQNTDWEATPFTPWPQTFPDNTNLAFADCDGDGEVDDDDLEEVILENFGQEREDVTPDLFAEEDPQNGLSLEIEALQEIVIANEELDLKISLGSEDRPAENFTGLILDIVFDPQLVIQGDDALKLEVNDEWAEGSEAELTTFVFRSEAGAGRASLGIIREDQAPISGAGELGTLSIVIEDIAVGVVEALELEFTNIRIGGRDLISAPLRELPAEVRVPFENAVTSDLEREEPKADIRLYPNPASREVTLELPVTDHWEYVELMDLRGRSWASYPVSGREILTLPLQNIPAGSYFLRVVGKQKTKNLRFLISR